MRAAPSLGHERSPADPSTPRLHVPLCHQEAACRLFPPCPGPSLRPVPDCPVLALPTVPWRPPRAARLRPAASPGPRVGGARSLPQHRQPRWARGLPPASHCPLSRSQQPPVPPEPGPALPRPPPPSMPPGDSVGDLMETGLQAVAPPAPRAPRPAPTPTVISSFILSQLFIEGRPA